MTPRTYAHALLLLAAASSVSARGLQQYEPPEETDVFSPVFCEVDENGFGGTIGVPAAVTFNYEMTLIPQDSADDVDESKDLAVLAVERSLSSFVLGTEAFDNFCSRRRLQVKAIRGRRLDAVGVTSNPPDDILDDVECAIPPTDGSSCVVVDAELTVFTLNQDVTIATALKALIQTAMNGGAFDDADATDTGTGNITSVAYVELTGDDDESDPDGNINEVRSAGSSDNNSNSAVIAGAAVGAAVVLGALVFYRRRHSQAAREAEFIPPVGGSST